jgi:hypothetical protein
MTGPKEGYHAVSYLADSRAMRGALNAGQAADIAEGRSFLWFIGEIDYLDVFGAKHKTGFCWRYDGAQKSFEQYGKDANKRT